jgi:hypothetical protein
MTASRLGESSGSFTHPAHLLLVLSCIVSLGWVGWIFELLFYAKSVSFGRFGCVMGFLFFFFAWSMFGYWLPRGHLQRLFSS